MAETSRDRPAGETSGTEQRPARRVVASALGFDLAAEATSLKEERSWQRGDRNARTLVEESGFRVVLTALKVGAQLSEHHTGGSVSIQTLAGCLRLRLGERVIDLPTGHLLVLEHNVPHSVEALEESVFLLAVTQSVD